MEELLMLAMLAAMVLVVAGGIEIRRSKKNGADEVYRMICGQWRKVKL